MKAEHGERLLRVDRHLQPHNMTDAIEFPLSTGGVLQPGALWLPRGQREVGGMSHAGIVKRIVKYKMFKAIEVEGVEGGARYFELETGLLVGFEVQLNRTEIVGTLMSLN